MSEQFCDHCENHCPASNPGCGYGRKRFGLKPENGHGKPHGGLPEGPLGLLRQCGHFLHHGSVGEDALAPLTEQEQQQLERMLTTLLDAWKAQAPKHGHHH